MLAFVFWHWPYPEVAAQAYETRLADFHRSLAQASPQDFHGSVAFRIDGAPWVPTGERGYEDWYLMDGSAAMDILNEAAIGAVCKEAHDGIVEYAASGAGGLCVGWAVSPCVVAWVDWLEQAARGHVLAAHSSAQPGAAAARSSQGIGSRIAPRSRNISATMLMMVSQGSFGFRSRLRRL